MKTLLQLQQLDQHVDQCQAREVEIPKQKNKFDHQRAQLVKELEEREKQCQDFLLEQKDCEGHIEVCNTQIIKYNEQLNIVKKNEEYQALLHEIDLQKKQIATKEERIITILVELDEANAKLEEDRKRIKSEQEEIDRQCAVIDEELGEAVKHRKELQEQRIPLEEQVAPTLLKRYSRVKKGIKSGAAVVPLKDEVCGGCHMHLLAQVVNEILAGNKIHSCQHCGRLLYHPPNVEEASEQEQAAEA